MLMQGMMLLNIDTFRKLLYEYSIQEGFLFVRDKKKKSIVTAHCGSKGREWRVHAFPMHDEHLYVRHVSKIIHVS